MKGEVKVSQKKALAGGREGGGYGRKAMWLMSL